MIGTIDAEEGLGRGGTRLERNGHGLQRGTRGLVLQAHRAKVSPVRNGELLGIAVGGAHQLKEIGGKADSALTTAVRDPRVPTALRQILPSHQDGTVVGMARDMVIEVLARIRLVVREKPRFPEAEILDEDGVARKRILPVVA